MFSSSKESSASEISSFMRRSYVKNVALEFSIAVPLLLGAYLLSPSEGLARYFELVVYLIGGTTAGYYFSRDLDRAKIQFQTRDVVLLWMMSSIALIGGVFLAGTSVNVAVHGASVIPSLGRIASRMWTGLSLDNATSTAWGLLLVLLGIAMGRDIYHGQFTMLRPLSREKAAEVRELASSLQPLSEAMHRFGRSFSLEQLYGVLPEQARSAAPASGGMGDGHQIEEVLIGLRDQGVLTMKDGMINITPKGENLLSISRYVAGLRERGEEGAELCAYCGKPLRLSDKLMRLNYYGKPYAMHYTEREGVSIFGRLPYIDKVLGLRPAEVARAVYLKPKVLPTMDHKAALGLGIVGAVLAFSSYGFIVLNARSLPIPSEVSFFGGTLLSVSLIFGLCGVIGGLLTYVDPGSSYGGAMMLALLLFAMPFIGLTRQVVFAGYYASVGLIAIGGAISVRAHTMMA